MFDWGWDNFKPTKDILQNMVYEESLFFHPEKEVEVKKAKKEPISYGSKYKFYQ
jgi:mitogen-activated protein kinase 1/3